MSSQGADDLPSRDIDDADDVSRLMFSRIANGQIIEPFFEFRSDPDPESHRADSVAWRKIVQTDSSVHELGCSQQASYLADGKDKKYTGFRTANVREVRRVKTTRGHTFIVFHYPKQGEWHAHIQVVEAEGIQIDKNDRRDINGEMQKLFCAPIKHQCQDDV